MTGASSGIGRAVAEHLLADEWRVVGLARTGDVPAGAELVRGDAVDPDVLDRLVGHAGDRIDGLVCAAGVPPRGPWDDRRHWDEVLQVDLTAPYELVRRAFGPLEAAAGAVVLVGSIVGAVEGSRRSPAYAAAKAGLEGLARSLALIGTPSGVRVNVVAPGAIATPFDPPRFPPDRRPDVPLGRMGTADEVAGLIGFLLGPGGAYITGAVLRVDGGRTATGGPDRVSGVSGDAGKARPGSEPSAECRRVIAS